jgi:hypothetical protein
MLKIATPISPCAPVLHVLTILALSIFVTVSSAYAATSSTNAATVSAVLHEVQRGLADAQTQVVDAGMPPFSSVELVLNTEYIRSVGGGVELVVVTIGGGHEAHFSQRLDIVLEPPAPFQPRDVSEKESIAKALSDAIVSAARGIERARFTQPPLVARKIVAEIKFAVTREVEGALGVKFAGLVVGPEGSLAESNLQTIIVTFEHQPRLDNK